MRFEADWSYLGKMPIFKGDAHIKNEPMLFGADLHFARNNGGPLTKAFIEKLEQFGYNKDCIIDSRVHMLKPGWSPCILGFHLDDFQRNPETGQPDYKNLKDGVVHILSIVGDASRTEFLDGPVDLRDPLPGEVVYDSFNRQIRRLIAQKDVWPVAIDNGDIIAFTNKTFHRGVPATKDGWRFFIRASFNDGRTPTNEIRRQTQVYLPVPEAGW